MKLQPMQFKNFQWPHNPAKLNVASARDIRELRVPFLGDILQDYGSKKRVITGEGEFNGSNCSSNFQQLAALFSAGGSGLLSLPDAEPFMATFVSLEQIGKSEPNCIQYRFLFWEDQSAKTNFVPSMQHHCYICTQSMNLWEIATAYGTTVGKLIQLNPQIMWPNKLNVGEQVVLP